LYTDADMRLNSQWIEGMIASINKNTGIIAGFTSIEPRSTFHSLQNLDLHFGQGMLKVLNDIGYSVSVIGNNMLVDKTRFDESGGYEAMDFSIVEDVSMLRSMSRNGSSIKMSYNQSTHLMTIGEKNWASLMNQRRRWFEGFKTTPVWLQLIMLCKFSFLPCLIYMSLVSPWFILGFVMKLILSMLFLREIEKSVNSDNSIFVVILFEFFEPILYYSTLICSILPNKIKWKGREF